MNIEEKDVVVSPPASKVQYKYAGFWLRFLAYMVDFIILFFFGLFIESLFGINNALMNAKSLSELKAVEASANYTMSIWASIVFGLVYYIVFWVDNDGATPGKKLLGIKIIKSNGEKIRFSNAIIRYIGTFISAFTILIGYLWIIWDKKKQALHDKIAGTLVIRTEHKPKIWLAIAITVLGIIIVFGYTALIMSLTFQLGLQEAKVNPGQFNQSQSQPCVAPGCDSNAPAVVSNSGSGQEPTGIGSNSNQQANVPPQTPYIYPSPTLFPTPTPFIPYETFKVPELGIQFQIPADLKDLIYTMSTSYRGRTASFSTTTLTNLDQANGGSDCNAVNGGLGGIAISDQFLDDGAADKQLGNKYYTISSLQSPCSVNSKVEQLRDQQHQELVASFQTIELIK